MKSNNEIQNWGFKDFITDKPLYVTLVLSVLVAYFIGGEYLRSIVSSAGSAMVEMSGALLGVVLAGLAIFIVFLDKKYIRVIDRLIRFENEFFVIKTVTFLTITCLIFGIGLIVLGEIPNWALRIIIGGALWAYLYLLVQIWELVKWLIEHAKARAMQAQQEEGEKKDM